MAELVKIEQWVEFWEIFEFYQEIISYNSFEVSFEFYSSSYSFEPEVLQPRTLDYTYVIGNRDNYGKNITLLIEGSKDNGVSWFTIATRTVGIGGLATLSGTLSTPELNYEQGITNVRMGVNGKIHDKNLKMYLQTGWINP